MAETALKFGPEWLRALSHGNSVVSPPSSPGLPKYKLADFRYGREEMLALFAKDYSLPEELKEFPHICVEKCQIPLALTPVSEDEQRIWARSVNSDVVLRLAGKGGGTNSTSNNISSRGRGGSVDRGRGRGRGNYYARGLSFEDGDEGPTSSFARPRPIERSQSIGEREQRWDDRERRYDRPYSGRGGIVDVSKKDGPRNSNDNWRKMALDQDRFADEEGDWRVAGSQASDNRGSGRGSWRNRGDDRGREDNDRTSINNSDVNLNGPTKSSSLNFKRKPGSEPFWDDDLDFGGDQLPEWSTVDNVDAERVGTFDASGAFMENKVENFCREEKEEEDISDTSDDEKRAKAVHVFHDGDGDSSVSENEGVEKDLRTSQGIKCVRTSAKHIDTLESKVENVDHNQKEMSQAKKNQKDVENSLLRNSHKPVEKKPCLPVKDLNCCNMHISVCEKFEDLPQQQEQCQKEHQSQHNQEQIIPNSPHGNVHNSNRTKEEGSHVSQTSSLLEEDGFAHLEKATENMMAEWTAEDDQRAIFQAVEKDAVLPTSHEDAYKWFYQDPQGEIQGPFLCQDMLEWFTAGYFIMGLMIRRGCDEKFVQLGELIKTWKRVPFSPGVNPPPLRATPQAAPSTQQSMPPPPPPPPASQQPKQDIQLRMLQQQQQLLQQHLIHQQLLLRQQQIHLLNQLKQQENFSSLTPQQQQQMIMEHITAQQQLHRLPSRRVGETANFSDQASPVLLPLLGLSVPQVLKNGAPFWGLTSATGTWPLDVNTPLPVGGSIWDVELSQENPSALEQRKKHQENEERTKTEGNKHKDENHLHSTKDSKLLLEEEDRKRQGEVEKKRKEELWMKEELKRKQEEEELKRQDEQRRLEEFKRIEEERKLELSKQEEQRRLEELRRHEEMERRRHEEIERRQQEELERRHQEELDRRRQEEIERRLHEEMERQLQEEMERRLQEEMKRRQQEEMERRRQEELERRKQEELERRRQEELERRRQEELERRQQEELERRRQEELERRRQEELERRRQEELERRQQEEMERRRQEELERRRQEELERRQQEELERRRLQEELERRRQEELERRRQEEVERQRQEEIERRKQEMERKGQEELEVPAWGGQNVATQSLALSLVEIQKLQEEKEKREREEQLHQHQQQLQQQKEQQVQHNKSSLTWGQMLTGNVPVKSLLEIQQEEAARLVKQQKAQKPQISSTLNNVGVWGNATTLLRGNPLPSWSANEVNTGGFWDDAISATNIQKTVKSSDSAFPALNNADKLGPGAVNKGKNIRTRKEKDTVMKLFETHTRQSTDEFTKWCTEALSSFPSSVHVPTFVAFLKDVESPYEVHDYVKSYLGEGKEVREFAKQYLERRSKYRNQSKETPAEENMWGPAPAITPISNKTSFQQQHHDFDGTATKGKKKKKNKMQKVDNSMLGFTVQADPYRINVGEIDHVEGM